MASVSACTSGNLQLLLLLSALQLQRLARDLIARVRWIGFRVAS